MKNAHSLEGRIEGAVAPSLAQLGYEVVRIRMIGQDGKNILQIMLERQDGANVSIEDCQKASRQISAVLDVENIIDDRYHLEVSSPGIDRPLTRLKDFEKYKGLEAKIETFEKTDGSRNFRGRLAGCDGEAVLLDNNLVNIAGSGNAEIIRINFNNIKSAKLVLTDELLAMHKGTGL